MTEDRKQKTDVRRQLTEKRWRGQVTVNRSQRRWMKNIIDMDQSLEDIFRENEYNVLKKVIVTVVYHSNIRSVILLHYRMIPC